MAPGQSCITRPSIPWWGRFVILGIGVLDKPLSGCGKYLFRQASRWGRLEFFPEGDPMRAEKFFGCLAAVTLALLVACRPPSRAGGDPTPTDGTGGGGSDPAGGTIGSGGGSGGAAGGGSGQGGTAGSGGTTPVGGSVASGGTIAVGGTLGAGGSVPSGGALASGGTTGTGGRTSEGGTSACTSTSVPSSFAWSASASLMDPVSDGSSHMLVAIKDPTVVLYGGKYDLYATVVDTSGNMNMTYTAFAAFATSGTATAYYMDYTPGFSGSRYSPQLFYMSGQKKWYLISQSSGPSYSTAADPSQSTTWTKPTAFFSSTPSIVTQNAGSGGIAWGDFRVICDTANCHMFFTNQNGSLFRSQTSVGSFPSGFGTPVVVMKGANANSLYASAQVYKVKGTGKYLLLAEAIGTGGRYIRSWTADALDGTWTALADTEANPFAGASNVTFSATKWTADISHGEIVRDGYDETMAINPCAMQYFFQGRNQYSTASPALLPWKLGLLTKTN
jgi:endo-1,4-beta-xylanase